MSNSKMLIDAAHPEETRVVVLKGNRVEEFDFESASKKQLRGNIYLAKVTRVEPSLQAAFVEYGGNRHGFLAFSEIHPDYYQIPMADRQALLEEEARAHRDEEDEPREPRGGDHRSRDGRRGGEGRGNGENRNGGGEGRGNGENRNGGGEGRGNGENRSGGGEGRGTGEGGERQARGEGRGERTERGGRSDRGQRRSRRHRRDAPATALDRRGPADESISEAAFEVGDDADLIETGAVFGEVPADVESGVVETETDHAAAHPVEAAESGASQHEHDAPASLEPNSIADAGLSPAETHPSEDAVSSAFGPESAEGETGAPTPSEAIVAGSEETPEVEPEAGAVVETAAVAEDDAREMEARETHERHHDDDHRIEPHDDDSQAADHEEEHVEQIGGDALSDVAPRPLRSRRHYKIQEVIKRRQILLIQVVKEERGNKGAALTTYLSLAGRYSVLMPNTAKGGGISRKITDGEDRKRLKAIAQELDVPEGMGVILRTAGASRSPVEVRRDFEYLLRMWESVRELTLKSSAPSLVYEEGSLIKRSIRDLYSKEVEEVVVSGEAGFAEARDFMLMLMPGNVKSVQFYRDPQPIFAKSGVEAQLDAMFSPHVTLKSGGYLVINQTEALVAIDVNSGRSTREHNIEDTALRTNLEAADEVARQLRLRDLAGLIVVDFIDMEEGRNNRAVERRIKEALKNDRARIQIGRISHFGLLEMSRQRIRTGVLEGSTVICPHCAGAGTVRSTASVALHVLRLVEDALLKDASFDLIVRSRAEVALYVLNQKRAKLVELEQRFGVTITVTADPTLTGMIYHAIDRGELATPAIAPAPRQDLVRVDSIAPIFEPGSESEDESFDAAETGDDSEGDGGSDEGTEGASADAGDGDGRRRKRRRRRRGRDRDATSGISADAAQPSDEGLSTMAEIGGDLTARPLVEEGREETVEDEPTSESQTLAPALEPAAAEPVLAVEPDVPAALVSEAGEAVVEVPKRRRSRRTVVRSDAEEAEAAETAAAAPAEEAPARPRRRRPARPRVAEASLPLADAPAAEEAPAAMEMGAGGSRPSADRDVGADTVEHHPPMAESEAPVALQSKVEMTPAVSEVELEPAASDLPKRSGWWQRAKSSFGA